jgi:HAD superfamily hydrolase (TIGR01490 family)
MARPFAVFDVDGTLIRWQLYHAIGDGMAKQGLMNKDGFERVRRARMNWKRRAGEDSFNEYEQALIKAFDGAIKGLEVEQFKQVVGKVFDEYKEQVYTYTRDLIESLKKQDYLLFAISGSPQIIVSLLAQFYGFDDYAGTSYEIEGSHFSGQKDLLLGRKGKLLKQLIKKHRATSIGSIGVGDSESDIDMLALTKRPIAFNPTKKLYDHAITNGWSIVVERKNVTYCLELQDDKYQLG